MPTRGRKKKRTDGAVADSGTPQNGKQILIGETADTLARVYASVLLEKDALGSNSVRIQAKNNKTLNTIAENLFKLEKLVGPFKGVRVSQAVRTGAMKKGVNVLLVLRNVDAAFQAIQFMAKEGFKVQSVIPRRLRETYGIHVNGMELLKPGHLVPIEIPESQLPPELQKPVNPTSVEKKLSPNPRAKNDKPKERLRKNGDKSGRHTKNESRLPRQAMSPSKDSRQRFEREPMRRPGAAREDSSSQRVNRFRRDAGNSTSPRSPSSRFQRGNGAPPATRSSRFQRTQQPSSPHTQQEHSPRFEDRAANRPMRSSLPPSPQPIRFDSSVRGGRQTSSPRSRFHSPQNGSSSSRFASSPARSPQPARAHNKPSTPPVRASSREDSRTQQRNSPRNSLLAPGRSPRNSLSTPGRYQVPTARGERVSPQNSPLRANVRDTPTSRGYSQPTYEKRHSGSLRDLPPGFQEAIGTLSADAPVFTPGNFGSERRSVMDKSSPSPPKPLMTPSERKQHSPGREQIWDSMFYMRHTNGSSEYNSMKPTPPKQQRTVNYSKANQNPGDMWNHRNPPAYQAPRIYPGLFPTQHSHLQSEHSFANDPYRREEDAWGREKVNRHSRSRFAMTDDFGYASDSSSSGSGNHNLDKHIDSLYDSPSDLPAPRHFGMHSYHLGREETPPNFMLKDASVRHLDPYGGSKYHKYFDPDEFYKEELLPLSMRRDPRDAYGDRMRMQQRERQRPHQGDNAPAPMQYRHARRTSPPKQQMANDPDMYHKPPPKIRSIPVTSSSSISPEITNAVKLAEPEPKERARDMTGLHYSRMSKEMMAFAKKHRAEMVDKLCKKELASETECYYIWKYMCHALGVEISWEEADLLKTEEVVSKAKTLVAKLKNQIRDNVKIEFTDHGVIVNEEYASAVDEMVLNLERIMFSNEGRDPFDLLDQVTPDTRPKFECKKSKKEEEEEEAKQKEMDINKPENWKVMLPETDVRFILYDCEYCAQRGLKSEGHWELNCYYYLTGCCSLCGSEEHISPYCPNPPAELTFHQSVMYVRQLAFYYGPSMVEYFPNIYQTLQSQYNDLVVWDPIQKRLVAQPIITNEPVILWRIFEENEKMKRAPLMRNPFNDPYGGLSPLPSPIMSLPFKDNDFEIKRLSLLRKSKNKVSPLKSPSLQRMKNSEQLEEIVDLELDDLEDPFTIGEYSGVNDILQDIPEQSFVESEVLDASPVLHPLQQQKQRGKKNLYQSDNALVPYNGGGLDPQEHIDLINARSIVPLTLPNTALDPLPFPNLPPADRNELIRRIQSGEFRSENLVYPIFPVPSSTMILKMESPQPVPYSGVAASVQ